MNIKDILAKLLKGEALTDDEKAFAESFDLQGELDRASASARRKAEAQTKDALKKHDELQKQIEELQAKLDEKEAAGKTSETELAKLAKKIAGLEKINAENEAKIKATARLDAIREAAKTYGINAAQGVSAKSLETLLDLAVGETDVTDADAMKAVLEQFKTDNPTMIAAAVKQGANVRGQQDDNSFKGVANPWKNESINLTKQIEISQKNPDLAKQMMAEAGVPAQA